MRSAVYEDCGVRSRQVGELLRTMVSRERTMPFQPMRVVIQAATRVVASRNPTTNVYGKLFLFVFFAVSSGALLRPKEEPLISDESPISDDNKSWAQSRLSNVIDAL